MAATSTESAAKPGESRRERGQYLGLQPQLLAEGVALVGADVVVEEVEEPGDAVDGDDDGGARGRGLLGDLEVPPPRVLLQIEVEQLVLELQRLADELDVAAPAHAAAAGADPAAHHDTSPDSAAADSATAAVHGRRKGRVLGERRSRLGFGFKRRKKLGRKEGDVRLGIGIDLEGGFTPETVGDSVSFASDS